MDIFVLKALVDELQQLAGATVTKAFQMSPDDVLLRLRRGKDWRLFFSTHATLQRVHLTMSRFDNPQRPPRFAAFLRAHLKRTRLQDITVQPYDRVVQLTWKRPGDTEATLTLIHELTGRQANMILLNQDDVVLEALKHVRLSATHHRSILPGCPYQPLPLPPQRVWLPALTRDHLSELEHQGQFDTPHLQRLLIGVSSILITELLYRSQSDPQRFWEHLQHLQQQYESSGLTLSISSTPEGARYLSVLPLTHCAASVESFDSAQEAATTFYESVVRFTHTEAMRRDVQKTLRQRLQKIRKKITNLQDDHQTLQSYLPYQHYGTLLVAQRLPRGADKADVINYYDPDQPKMTIPLDPRLSIQDNAQVYFKKYRKAKNGLVKVRTLLHQCAAEAHRLEAFTQQIEQAEDWTTLRVIAEALQQGSPGKQRREAAGSATKPAQPYRTFVSRDGYILYCGKSNHGNDVLLRQVATPDDIWLHAHQQAGAHVVIKSQSQQEIPRQTLLEAAAIAAFYSKGKHAAAVEVIYTRVKHVRKFRGARPGQVQITNYRRLEVAPRRPGT